MIEFGIQSGQPLGLCIDLRVHVRTLYADWELRGQVCIRILCGCCKGPPSVLLTPLICAAVCCLALDHAGTVLAAPSRGPPQLHLVWQGQQPLRQRQQQRQDCPAQQLGSSRWVLVPGVWSSSGTRGQGLAGGQPREGRPLVL
jgi:hypothetical protein